MKIRRRDNIALHVKLAEQNEVLLKNTIYFAPDHFHLQVVRSGDKLLAKLHKAPTVSGFCPSITVLFESASEACGRRSVGALLTGMGSDGAKGLLSMKNVKAHTFIQDKESAVVFGMAGVAKQMGAVDKIIELDKIAAYLSEIALK